MVKLLICDACIVNGEAAPSGSEVVTDQATANLLIGMGRAVLAPEPAPEPEAPEKDPEPAPEPPKPAPRPRARATQPTTTEKED